MCTLREKYKGTKFPNETNFIDRSQILMFFLNIETYTFSSECNNLRLEQSLEFNQAFLSLKEFKIFFERYHSKAHFLVSVCCIYFIMENIPAHRDLFQFIEILRQYSNFKLLNWL